MEKKRSWKIVLKQELSLKIDIKIPGFLSEL